MLQVVLFQRWRSLRPLLTMQHSHLLRYLLPLRMIKGKSPEIPPLCKIYFLGQCICASVHMGGENATKVCLCILSLQTCAS
ncbi:hypothetical protein POPTR_001G023000v4 [Populus trichocarpa]|uniref:Uncharacterized protein n=1 Tax=Populus trichocarpa TaxID=3694 RepID=A0ACC0TH38_POPTR|nr:hypothetical protein BDE02_01G021700 [Populus trichocarpa]KAI9400699.1 hypothetical protein POPTR_001G023000v4 [Populus trichocarpa]